MSQREETRDDVHSSETLLHGEQDSQTEARSNGSNGSSVSKSLKPQGDINNRPKRRSSRKRRSSENKDPSTSKTPYKPLNSRSLNLDFEDKVLPLSNGSNGSSVSKSLKPQGDINNRPKRRSSRKRRSSENKDPSTSKTPYKPLNSRSLNLDFEDKVLPLRMSTQCGETSDSDASFKSDMSKEDVINFKERRSSLGIRLKCSTSTGFNRNHSQGPIITKERHSSLKKSPMTSGEKGSSWTQG